MKRAFGSIFTILFFTGASALAERTPVSVVYGPVSDGYISSIDQDTIEPMKDLVLISQPVELRPVTSTEKVFTLKLQKEFQDQYRQRFGFTEAQQFLNDPVDVTFYGNTHGYSKEDEKHRADRRSFGEYIVKKTMEFHVDNYFKSEPQLKKVYEFKERISHLDVKVNEETKINSNYDFAGNYVTTTVENPYVNARLQLDMAGSTPGAINDTTFALYRGITSTITAETYYKFNSNLYSAVVRKHVSDNIETSVTMETSSRDTNDRPTGTMFLVGLSLLN